MPILWFTTIKIQIKISYCYFSLAMITLFQNDHMAQSEVDFFKDMSVCWSTQIWPMYNSPIFSDSFIQARIIFFSWSLFRWRSILIRVFVDIELSTKKPILIDLKNKTIKNLLSVSKYHWILVCCCFCGCSIVIAHFIDRCQALLSCSKNNIDLRFYRNLCQW